MHETPLWQGWGLRLLLAVFLATLGAIAAVVIDLARRRETVARHETEISLDVAQTAIDTYLTNVSENSLLKEQDSDDIRRLRYDLLKGALTYYEQFAAQRKNDARLRQQLANAYFRVGQITSEIGTKAQAMDAFRSALLIWGPLVEANPKSHDLANNLAECHLAIGRLESIGDEFPTALEELRRSSAILERVTEEDPAEPRYQASLADCYSEIGVALAKQGKLGESLAIHAKARAIQQTLIDRYPDNLAYKRGLAENLNAIGFAYYKRHEIPAALRTFHEVERFCQSLTKSDSSRPYPTWLLNLLALTKSNIGNIHKENGALAQALPSFEEALKYRSDLADLHPSVTLFREKLAVSYREMAELGHRAHMDANALLLSQKAVDVFESLVRQQPEQARFHSELARSWDDLGLRHDEARKNAEAMRAFESAVREQRAAIAISKSADDQKLVLCYYLDNLGEQAVDLGRPEEGLPHYEQALQGRRELSQRHPEDRRYTFELVTALVALGNIHRHVGRIDAARPMFADAQYVLETALKSTPGDPAASGSASPSRSRTKPRCWPTRCSSKRPSRCSKMRPRVFAGSLNTRQRQTSWPSNGSGAVKRSGTSAESSAT